MAALKRIMKIVGIILLVVLLLSAVIALFQWKNIGAVITGLKETPETISKKREENNQKLVEKVNEYMQEELREPTEEEKTLIDEGEMTLAEVYSKIISEKNDKVVEYDTEKEKFIEKEKPSAEKSETKSTDKKSSAESIVNKYISKLYALEAAYSAKAEGIISSGANHYNTLVANGTEKATARASTISNFTGTVRGVMADCDAKVEAIIVEMEAELKAIGAETGIIDTVRKTYASEKSLKLSYYSNKYLK